MTRANTDALLMSAALSEDAGREFDIKTGFKIAGVSVSPKFYAKFTQPILDDPETDEELYEQVEAIYQDKRLES